MLSARVKKILIHYMCPYEGGPDEMYEDRSSLYTGYACSKVHFCGDILLKSSSLPCLSTVFKKKKKPEF